MNNQSKTRDGLMNELQELHYENLEISHTLINKKQ
jgi:hypothetical protein